MIVRWFIVYIIGVHRYQHRSGKASESSPHHKVCKISQGCCFSRSVDPSLRLEAKFKGQTAIALGFWSAGVWGASHFWTQLVIGVRICPNSVGDVPSLCQGISSFQPFFHHAKYQGRRRLALFQMASTLNEWISCYCHIMSSCKYV